MERCKALLRLLSCNMFVEVSVYCYNSAVLACHRTLASSDKNIRKVPKWQKTKSSGRRERRGVGKTAT